MTDVIEVLAARQWERMTRSTVAYADIPEADKRACRALVAPVLADVRELDLAAIHAANLAAINDEIDAAGDIVRARANP